MAQYFILPSVIAKTLKIHRVEQVKGLVLRKIVHIQTADRLQFHRFGVDSIALAVNLPLDMVTDCMQELHEEGIITYYRPNEKIKPENPAGEVSLNIPIYEAKALISGLWVSL